MVSLVSTRLPRTSNILGRAGRDPVATTIALAETRLPSSSVRSTNLALPRTRIPDGIWSIVSSVAATKASLSLRKRLMTAVASMVRADIRMPKIVAQRTP
jgi:hypothetical protein